MAEVVQSLKSRLIRMPIYGGGADIFPGSFVMPGVTAETDDGVLIKNTAASNADVVGILAELHDYSETGDALVDGSVSWFAPAGGNDLAYPSRLVEICDAHTIVRIEQDLTSKIAVAGYNAGTKTVTITSLEDNIDTGFLYVASGAGAGQIEFINTSASGSCTIPTAFSTAIDNTSYVCKILPLFHQAIVWTAPSATAGTKVGTTAAVGTGRCNILARYIKRNGLDEMLDPNNHGGLTGLNSLSQFSIYYLLQLVNTALHPID
jgi:hypothetical protein